MTSLSGGDPWIFLMDASRRGITETVPFNGS
jgi:hypothetical protein